MAEQDEEPTCGRGLAASAAVPTALAAVAAGITRNLELHLRSLDPDDPAAAQEKEVYERIARSLHSAAGDLRAAAEQMAAAVDLPMGAHDMAAITTTDVGDAFERHVAAEDDLRRLLEDRRDGNEQMVAMIRAAVEEP